MKKLMIVASFMALMTCNQITSLILPPQDTAKTEEYAVYSALIQTRHIGSRGPELIVIGDQTSLFPGLEDLSDTLKYVRENLPGITDELAADLEAKNKQPQLLEPLLDISAKYVFVSKQEMETIFQSQDGWNIFYEKYPNSQGHMTLSRVGFNRQMDAALVYVGNQSGWLAGAGFYVLLEKVDGRWTIQGEVMVWIS